MDDPFSGGSHGAPSNNAHSDFLGMTAPTPSMAAHQVPQAPHSGGFNPAMMQQQYGQQQQQQQQQQQPPRHNTQNAFSNNNNQGPFGGLAWS